MEYSSSSGSSAVGLTWEFHFHCKKAIEVSISTHNFCMDASTRLLLPCLVYVLLECFTMYYCVTLQNEELLRILLFGVQVLEQYASVEISSLSDEATKLLLNFVKLASQVLNWHFCHTHRIH